MNKSNWTEEDHIEYAEMKRDEARDEWKERKREFEEWMKSCDYPDETEGSEIARANREECNKLTWEERGKLQQNFDDWLLWMLVDAKFKRDREW